MTGANSSISNSKMKKLLIHIAIVLALLAVVDRLAGWGLDWLRDHSPDGRYFKTKYSLEIAQEDVIVLGSSRGEMNYVSQVIEDSLGMSCWNASRGGQGMPYFRAIQEGILNRYAPKVVILNVDDYDLEFPPNYEHAGVLRPFYHNHPEIHHILDQTSTFEWLLMQSRLYAYNSSYYYLIRPYFVQGLDGKTSDKGWKPRVDTMSVEMGKNLEPEPPKMPLNPEGVALFDALVKQFQDKGCKMFMVVSPNFGRSVDSSTTIEYLRKTSRERNIPLFVYSNDSAFITKPDYFTDPNHLNVEGARLFTSDLVRHIKPLVVHNQQLSSHD